MAFCPQRPPKAESQLESLGQGQTATLVIIQLSQDVHGLQLDSFQVLEAAEAMNFIQFLGGATPTIDTVNSVSDFF